MTNRDGFGVRIGADPSGTVGRWSVGAGPADPAGGLLVRGRCWVLIRSARSDGSPLVGVISGSSGRWCCGTFCGVLRRVDGWRVLWAIRCASGRLLGLLRWSAGVLRVRFLFA